MVLSFLWRIRGLILTAFVVAFMLFLVNRTAGMRYEGGMLGRTLLEISAPVQSAVSSLVKELNEIVQVFHTINSLEAENAELRRQVKELKPLRVRLSELEAENQRLRMLLGFQERTPLELKFARVIGRSPDRWFSTMIIDVGAKDGIKEGMPVVTPSGLVGRVISSTERASTVMLITDPDSGIGGMTQRSRDAGVVLGRLGQTELLELRFFSRDAQPKLGDVVITSGLGVFFPKGLEIGTIVNIREGDYGLVKYADVVPSVDMSRLEEVAVIITPKEQAQVALEPLLEIYHQASYRNVPGRFALK